MLDRLDVAEAALFEEFLEDDTGRDVCNFLEQIRVDVDCDRTGPAVSVSAVLVDSVSFLAGWNRHSVRFQADWDRQGIRDSYNEVNKQQISHFSALWAMSVCLKSQGLASPCGPRRITRLDL